MSINWNDVLIAREVSIKLKRNEKFVYLLWRSNSDLLLKDSVAMKGKTLLITREGYEHLKRITEKEDAEKLKEQELKLKGNLQLKLDIAR